MSNTGPFSSAAKPDDIAQAEQLLDQLNSILPSDEKALLEWRKKFENLDLAGPQAAQLAQRMTYVAVNYSNAGDIDHVYTDLSCKLQTLCNKHRDGNEIAIPAVLETLGDIPFQTAPYKKENHSRQQKAVKLFAIAIENKPELLTQEKQVQAYIQIIHGRGSWHDTAQKVAKAKPLTPEVAAKVINALREHYDSWNTRQQESARNLIGEIVLQNPEVIRAPAAEPGQVYQVAPDVFC